MATHLAEVVRSHAYELLTRQESKRLLDALAETQPKLVEELVPKLLSLGEVQKVLQQLLREQVSIRDLPAILETLIDTAPLTKNPVQLVETVRQTLGRALVQPLLINDGKLHLVALDPAVEDEINQAFDPQAAGRGQQARQPAFIRRLLDSLKRIVGDKTVMDSTVLLLREPRALSPAPSA